MSAVGISVQCELVSVLVVRLTAVWYPGGYVENSGDASKEEDSAGLHSLARYRVRIYSIMVLAWGCLTLINLQCHCYFDCSPCSRYFGTMGIRYGI